MKSKLTPYAPTLLDLKLAGKTLEELRAWLKGEGVTVALSTLADFVSQLLSQRERDQLLDRITSGASQVREVEERFKDNPAPELETVIKIYRVLILQLSTSGQTDPELLKLANRLTQTIMDFISGQTKARLEEQKLAIADRRTKLLEKKADAYDRAQAALTEAKNSKGGITPETLTRIERELNLL